MRRGASLERGFWERWRPAGSGIDLVIGQRAGETPALPGKTG